jgi:hypothetical protein
MLVFSTPLVNCCPSIFSPTSPTPPPLPKVNEQYVCGCVGGGVGGVELYCKPYSTGVYHSVSDQIQNLQNCYNTPNKNTNKYNILGLVSLRFLHLWVRGVEV